MIKLWDQKIAKLKSELNITSIYRKLGTFPRKDEVNDRFRDLEDFSESAKVSIIQLK